MLFLVADMLHLDCCAHSSLAFAWLLFSPTVDTRDSTARHSMVILPGSGRMLGHQWVLGGKLSVHPAIPGQGELSRLGPAASWPSPPPRRSWLVNILNSHGPKTAVAASTLGPGSVKEPVQRMALCQGAWSRQPLEFRVFRCRLTSCFRCSCGSGLPTSGHLAGRALNWKPHSSCFDRQAARSGKPTALEHRSTSQHHSVLRNGHHKLSALVTQFSEPMASST